MTVYATYMEYITNDRGQYRLDPETGGYLVRLECSNGQSFNTTVPQNFGQFSRSEQRSILDNKCQQQFSEREFQQDSPAPNFNIPEPPPGFPMDVPPLFPDGQAPFLGGDEFDERQPSRREPECVQEYKNGRPTGDAYCYGSPGDLPRRLRPRGGRGPDWD